MLAKPTIMSLQSFSFPFTSAWRSGTLCAMDQTLAGFRLVPYSPSQEELRILWAAAFSPARLGVIECRARRATHIASNAQDRLPIRPID